MSEVQEESSHSNNISVFSVLILSDDESITSLLSSIFVHCGYRVEIEIEISDVCVVHSESQRDLIILDLDLEENSVERIAGFQKIYPHIEIVTMTSNNSKETETGVRIQKVAYHLIKPFDVREILSVVRHMAMKKSNFTEYLKK